MQIVHDRAGLLRYMQTAVKVSGTNPVLVDSYLNDAIEIDVDALADGNDVHIAGIMEHIEEAGVHSRSEEHTSELQSLMRSSYDVFCMIKNTIYKRRAIIYKE